MVDELDKKDCAGYDKCKKYSGEEDLHCEDCSNYLPTEVVI